MTTKPVTYKIGDQITKEQALGFALDIARRGLGHVEPNPCVGSVVINEKTNKLISYGHHQKFGGAHAEVEALKDLEDGEGLTLIVTLEPCSHFGKTPPCAELVVSKKFDKLIYIDKDPNPKVSGRGIELIKSSGIQVEQAPISFSKINRRLNSKFFYAFENKATFFHLKWAQSLDGKTSLNGKSKWITGEESREHGQFLRAQSDAVLIGRETLMQDDPSLNIRLAGFDKQNKVIVFDPQLKSLNEIKNKNVFKLRPPKSVIFLCDETKQKTNEDVLFLNLNKNPQGEYCLKTLAEDLYDQFGLQSVFVEGGAATLGAFLMQNAYRRISIFTAPVLLGANAKSPFESLEFNNIDQKTVFSIEHQCFFGPDVFRDLYIES